MLLALRLFALSAGALQLFVAAHAAQRPVGPFRVALVALLVLNGLAALRLALLGQAPEAELLFLVLDGATGPALLAAGLLALRFPDHDRRDRAGWVLLGGAFALLVPLAVAAPADGFRALAGPYDWLHTFPALAGLALAGVGLARAVATARADRIAEAGLLALGFLPTLAENAVAYVDQARFGFFLDSPPRLLGTVAVLAGAAAAVAWLAWPSRRNRGWRGVLLLVMLACAAIYPAYFGVAGGADSPQRFAVFLGTTLSFYVLRPLGAGLAYARTKTLWSVADVALGAALLAGGKLLSRAAFGVPLDELAWADLLGASLAVLLACLASAALRGWFGPPRGPGVDRPTSDDLLGRFLLDQYRLHGPDRHATKQEIEAATGITENNLAATIRRLERRLDPAAAPGTFVAERRVGVRGRKCYRLTAQGLARLGPAPAPRTRY